jgi:protein TonB
MMGGPEVVPRFPHPVLQEFITAAVDAVRRTRYASPSAAPAVFTTIVHFTRGDAVAATRTVPSVQRVSAAGAIKVGAIKPPVKVKDVRPVYPVGARDAGIQGVVILEVRVEADGRVGSAGVVRSVPELDQAALDAVYQWEFRPTLLNGAPVPVIMMITIQFTAG